MQSIETQTKAIIHIWLTCQDSYLYENNYCWHHGNHDSSLMLIELSKVKYGMSL